jgi:signal peptidase I
VAGGSFAALQDDGSGHAAEDRERVAVDRTAYAEASPLPGDLVYLLSPTSLGHIRYATVRRVIGVPGDLVEVLDGVVHLDGKPLWEPYVVWGATYSWGPGLVPEDEYFVLGDNRQASADSRVFDFIPRADILGKVVLTGRGGAGGR